MIGDQGIDRIESRDVLKVLSPIWLKINETADRVKQRMNVVFDWSIASGYRSGNPVHGITKVLPKHNGADNHFAPCPTLTRQLSFMRYARTMPMTWEAALHSSFSS